MAGLQRYASVLAREEARLKLLLTVGTSTASEIAVCRVNGTIMREQLDKTPDSVLRYDRLGRDPTTGVEGPDRWLFDSLQAASKKVHPAYAAPDGVAKKLAEYIDLGIEIQSWGRIGPKSITDTANGLNYLILGENPLVRRINGIVADALLEWARAQPNTQEFHARSATDGLYELLRDRRDLTALLRLGQRLPMDVEVSNVPIDRPTVVTVIELAIGLVPVVGNAVALYESWAGVDMFGYRLTEVERGILAASVLLPVAGRLAKGGRALYTEARLVALYGSDAAAWTRAVRNGQQGAAVREVLATVDVAERELRVTKSLKGATAVAAAKAVDSVAHAAAVVVRNELDVLAETTLANLAASFKALASLDGPALLRVLRKGVHVDHLKGQLLEELIESRIVPWLSTREGGFALGLTVPAGKKLEFIPGHLVRDLSGRQLTDGILAYRSGDELVIAAVFEAKAGKHAARELSFARGRASDLTKDELRELTANAKDVWAEQRDAAKAAGQPFTRTLDEVKKEYTLSERGGQVRRDIERLADSVSSRSHLRIGGQNTFIQFSPTKTKFFGVVPSGVGTRTIEAELAAEKVTFELIAAPMTTSDLTSAAAQMVPAARTVVDSMAP